MVENASFKKWLWCCVLLCAAVVHCSRMGSKKHTMDPQRAVATPHYIQLPVVSEVDTNADSSKETPVPVRPTLPNEVNVHALIHQNQGTALPDSTVRQIEDAMRKARELPRGSVLQAAFQTPDNQRVVIYSRRTERWGHRLYLHLGFLTSDRKWKQRKKVALSQPGVNHVELLVVSGKYVEAPFVAALADLNQDGLPELLVLHEWLSSGECGPGSTAVSTLSVLDPNTLEMRLEFQVTRHPGGEPAVEAVLQRLSPHRLKLTFFEEKTSYCGDKDMDGCFVRPLGDSTLYVWPHRGPLQILEQRSPFFPMRGDDGLWSSVFTRTQQLPQSDSALGKGKDSARDNELKTLSASLVPGEISSWMVRLQDPAVTARPPSFRGSPQYIDARDRSEAPSLEDEDSMPEEEMEPVSLPGTATYLVIGQTPGKGVWVGSIRTQNKKPTLIHAGWLASPTGWEWNLAALRGRAIKASLDDANQDQRDEVWLKLPFSKGGQIWWWWYLLDAQSHRVLWQHPINQLALPASEKDPILEEACGWGLFDRRRAPSESPIIELAWDCKDPRKTQYFQLMKGVAYWRTLSQTAAQRFWKIPYVEKKKTQTADSSSTAGCSE